MTDTATPVRLTKRNVVAALKRAVRKRGRDFSYRKTFGTRCRYVTPNGAPACIVGEALMDLGVPASAFNRINSKPAVHAIPTLSDRHIVSFDDYEVIELLNEVQYQQDSGSTWGYALDMVIG